MPASVKASFIFSSRADCTAPKSALLTWAAMPYLTSAALASDGSIFIGSGNGLLYSLDSSGTLLWSYRTELAVQSSPAIWSTGKVGVGSDDGRLYVFGGPIVPTPTPRPTATPPPQPTPRLAVNVNSRTVKAGGRFTLDVIVQPLGFKFDAYAVILGPGATYSCVLGRPDTLLHGVRALAGKVHGLDRPYSATLYSNPALPPGIEGKYEVIVGLVRQGRPPEKANAIYQYLSELTVTVQ